MNIKKLTGLLLLILISAFVYQMLTRDRSSSDRSLNTRTITDMRNRRVDIADPLERIALLGGPTGQIAFILGVQDKLCAVTNTLRMSTLVREVYPKIVHLPGPRTAAGQINIEELIQSNPQLVVATEIDGDIVTAKTRLPVAFLDDSMGEGIGDIKKEIRFYAYLFNTMDRAENYIRHLEALLSLVRQKTEGIPEDMKKNVFQGYSPSHLVTLGGDTFMQERIEIAGCKNAAAEITTIGKRTGLHSGLGEVSMEQVIQWDPDLLVINHGSLNELERHPQWKNIKAVKNGQVFSQPAGIFIFNRPTAESAAVFPLWLAAKAYPERFADIDIKAVIKQFYMDVMQIDISDAQAESVLDGSYEFRIKKGVQHKG